MKALRVAWGFRLFLNLRKKKHNYPFATFGAAWAKKNPAVTARFFQEYMQIITTHFQETGGGARKKLSFNKLMRFANV
jgi:hypothetical protein